MLARTSLALNSGAHVEVLSTTNHFGTANIDFTDNEFGQTVIGTAVNNILDGGGGSDRLGAGRQRHPRLHHHAWRRQCRPHPGFRGGIDRIALDNAVFAGLSEGALAAGAFVVGSAARDLDDRIIYNAATGEIFFDADGNGAGAALLFATVTVGPCSMPATSVI